MVSREKVSPVPGVPHEATLLLRDLMLARGEFEKMAAARLSVNTTDYRALGVLLGQGPVSATTIAQELGMTPSATSNVIERLESLGHVVRERDPDDRRRIIVRATPESRRRAMGAIEPVIGAVEAHVRSLDPAGADAVVTYLRTVREVLEGVIADLSDEAAPPAGPDGT